MAKQQGKSFLLRLDETTMELVEKWATDEFRSVNGQLQWIIAESLKRHKRTNSKRDKGVKRPDNNEKSE